MEYKVGETVISPKDLNCSFCSENIELLKVYSFSKKTFDNCEDWSGEGAICYKIADFNVRVTDNKTIFFYGDPVQYGFFNQTPRILHFLPVGTCPIPEGFHVTGSYDFEEEYKTPISMLDFGMLIYDFLAKVLSSKKTISIAHDKEYQKGIQLGSVEINDDALPF